MARFEIGDIVFDIRYGWGIVREGFTNSTITVWFKEVQVNTSYDIRFAPKILSFTEYSLDGHSLERPEPSWGNIWEEYFKSPHGSVMEFFNENFEPPVRKCK